MLNLVAILTAIVCLLIIGVVIIQNPKGGGVDSTFGGTAANQMFGAARTTDIVEKWTWYLAIGLFILCIVASLMVGKPTTVEAPLLSQ